MPYGTELAHVQTLWRPVAANWVGEEAITTFWLNHIHFAGNGFDWTTAVGDIADGIAARYNTHWDALAAYVSVQAHLVAVKVSHIDSTGHDLDVATSSGSPLPLAGEAGGTMMPPEVALCVSEWGYEPGTFTTHPGRKRGRFYLPYLPSSTLTAQGALSDAEVLAIVTAWQAFLNDVQGMHVGSTLPGSDSDYMSLVNASKVDATVTQVGWISVDNHFDSQRRRQHQVPPTKQVLTISHS